jgi:hypothetical protein
VLEALDGSTGRVPELQQIRAVANHFGVSLLATAVRLINLDLAEKRLYGAVNKLRSRAIRRVAGADRYATSAALARDPLSEALDRSVAWVATGGDFPDGLVAGPAAAREGVRLLLVAGRDLDRSAATRDVLRTDRPAVLRLAGGSAAISTRTEGQLAALLR